MQDCFADRVLVPAAVLGSSDGGHYTQLEVATPAVIRLDPRRANKLIEFTNGNKTASTDGRWSSALADNLGVRQGSVLRFAVKLEGEGGAAVGFVDSCTFKPALQVRNDLRASFSSGSCVPPGIRHCCPTCCCVAMLLRWYCCCCCRTWVRRPARGRCPRQARSRAATARASR